MGKTRYVVRLPQQVVVVIETSVCEENYNLSLSDWVKGVRSSDDSVSFMYEFKWHHGDNINVDCCELYGRFVRSLDNTIAVGLCVSHYPVVYYTVEEFMKLFRIGKGNLGWCLSSVINVS